MDQSLNVIFTYIIENAIPVYDVQREMLITQTMHNDLNSRFPPRFIEPSQLTAETNAKSKLRFTISYFSTHRLNALSRNKNRIIIDTGASMSATSDKCLLKNIIPCQDVEASSAFGKLIKPN